MSAKNIYTIPAGRPFAQVLVQSLFDETKGAPEKLSSYLILLPTRRAVRVLQEAFINLNNGAPLLLPRLQPLGDVEEEELSLSLAGHDATMLELPPAISPLKRQLLLARMVREMRASISFEQSLALADALARLMDQAYIQGLDFANLAALVPEEFAEHWQITLDFLQIISAHWPKILEEENVIDSAERRNILIRSLGAYWKKHPPAYPVIAAGSTGSIPATAELLDTIAALPQGRVILPGLDSEIDEESWNALEESHPQAGLKHLLETMNVDRASVKLWDGDSQKAVARRFLAREIMRPAATTQGWTDIATSRTQKDRLQQGLEDLSWLECANEREEAQCIAILLRETLEHKGRTAVLVTPDRALARRVAVSCTAWDIKIDDSAGTPLDQTRTGIFLKLILEAALAEFAPVALLALLKHPLLRIPVEDRHAQIESIDRALRGLRPAPGFAGLKERIGAGNPVLNFIEPYFTALQHTGTASLLSWHIETAEALAGADALWQGHEGEAANLFFAELLEQTGSFSTLNLQDYAVLVSRLMENKTLRPVFGTQARLKILGQLEARLVQADLVILGGLNEGTWPPDPGHDPWMSRPMRGSFGLPSPEHAVSLAAHDFVQGFCAPRVVLTRARRKDGSPAIPARWLQRFAAVLDAAGIPKDSVMSSPALSWARRMHDAPDFQPGARPAPRPPLAERPRHISLTRIETWLQDPYSIYARYILGLKKLDPLEKPLDAAERGTILHTILNNFTARWPDQLPADAASQLVAMARDTLQDYHEDPAVWGFWQPRFRRLAEKFIELETTWRRKAKFLRGEIKGSLSWQAPGGPFTITGTADRIDRMEDGGALIDYKSGGTYAPSAILSGKLPQLPLEALILESGGFADIGPLNIRSLSYWKLTGGRDPGEIIEIESALPEILSRTNDGLRNLVAVFDNEQTPYLNLPDAERLLRFNDYEHLARVREWATLGEDVDDGAEAA